MTKIDLLTRKSDKLEGLLRRAGEGVRTEKGQVNTKSMFMQNVL
jgi:hypothetical protein